MDAYLSGPFRFNSRVCCTGQTAEVCGAAVGVGDVVGAVHVADNQLGEKGGTAVAEALKTNTALTQLNLRGE